MLPSGRVYSVGACLENMRLPSSHHWTKPWLALGDHVVRTRKSYQWFRFRRGPITQIVRGARDWPPMILIAIRPTPRALRIVQQRFATSERTLPLKPSSLCHSVNQFHSPNVALKRGGKRIEK